MPARKRLAVAAALALAIPGCSGIPGRDPTGSRAAPRSTSAPAAAATVVPDTLQDGRLPEPGSTHGVADNPIVAGRLVRGSGAAVDVQLAYLRFWVERARSLRTGEVDDEALARVAVGPAAEGVFDTVRDLAASDQHAEGGSTLNLRSVKVSDGTARLVDCFSDRSVLVDAAGEPVEPPDLATHPLRVTVVRDGDRWRVRSFQRARASTCR